MGPDRTRWGGQTRPDGVGTGPDVGWGPDRTGGGGVGPERYDADVRQILGSQDFPENLQKTLFDGFPNAGKKPSKNPKKTNRRPRKF